MCNNMVDQKIFEQRLHLLRESYLACLLKLAYDWHLKVLMSIANVTMGDSENNSEDDLHSDRALLKTKERNIISWSESAM